MAEEFVRKEHFDEFALRMGERFLGIEKRMEQGFAHAEKAREQNFVHLNQRLDGIERSLSDIRADLRQMRNWLISLYVFIALGFLGVLVREFLFKGT
jgi:hypothetical protein